MRSGLQGHYVVVELVVLKNLLKNGKSPVGETVRFLQMILDGISLHAVEGSVEDRARFREEIATYSARLDESLSPDQVKEIITSALESLRRLNLRSAELTTTQINELRWVIRTMTDTITFLSESRTTAVHQLNFLERELEQAAELDDVRLLRSKLQNCLQVVREETARLQSESEAHTQAIRTQVVGSNGTPEAPTTPKALDPPRRIGTLDQVTGLPGRYIAERMISEKITAKKECALALFLVDRLASINKRHGRGIGDEVLLQVAQHLAQGLPSQTSLCRWSGPAFAAFADIDSTFEDIQRAWQRIGSAQIDRTFESAKRSVMLRITTSMLMQPLTETSSPEELFHQLDQFVATHTCNGETEQ